MDRKRNSIGGLVGKIVGGKIINPHVTGKISVAGSKETLSVGGIAGESENTDIINPSAQVTIEYIDDAFVKLKELLQENVKNEKEKAYLINLLTKMQSSKHKPREFKELYNKFISAAANYISIISYLLPYLKKIFESRGL